MIRQVFDRRRFLMVIVATVMIAVFLSAGCGKQETPAESETEQRSSQEIVEEMVVSFGEYEKEASARVSELLQELDAVDPDAAKRWDMIMDCWMNLDDDVTVHPDVLPDGLPDTEELCIVVLGFQLKPDGSMKDELIERLKVAFESAEKYPNAYIVCTGGGTASENKSATEAGKMAEWLIENGIDESRIIVEDQSRTTAQNALYTYEILSEQYPQISQLAIVSSDYHIPTGTLLFEAESILRAEEAGEENLHVVSNAAWGAPPRTITSKFQSGALLELSGNQEAAYDIYRNNNSAQKPTQPEK